MADTVPDDLDALRQAALQTTKSAVAAEPVNEDVQQTAAADTLMTGTSPLPVQATTESEDMETA